MTPLIIMVGANKGGVGKTTVSRAVDDYLQSKRTTRKVFDSEWPAGDLKRFAPASEVIDVEKVDDQMKVFDTVDGVSLLDVRAGLLIPTLESLARVRLLDDVRAGKINLALLHVIGPTIASFDEVDRATDIIGGGSKHYLVKNYINETGFFEWDADGRFAQLFEKMKSNLIVVPHLPARASEEVQKLGGSFDAYAQGPGSRMLRGYVRDWLDRTWTALDQVGLGVHVLSATEGH